MAAKHMEPKTTKNKIDFLPQISDEDSSFKKDLSFLGALFLLLTLIGLGDFFNKRRAGVCSCLLAYPIARTIKAL